MAHHKSVGNLFSVSPLKSFLHWLRELERDVVFSVLAMGFLRLFNGFIGCKSTKNQKLTIAKEWEKCYFYIKVLGVRGWALGGLCGKREKWGLYVQGFKGSNAARSKGSKFKGSKVQSSRALFSIFTLSDGC
ncbi:MAG: hypothetical protein Q7U54_19255 [Bacteroidales bacterium]|nr:hypothetical protein [Bacteroidales bacterium]